MTTFSTAADNQPAVTIHVLQGERSMAKDNRTIGQFTLDGIPPAPRGVPQIEVTFDLDSNSILSVTAKDKASGKQSNIRIEGGSNLSKDEIERMKREAEEFAEADKLEKEKVEKLNAADSMIFQTEKQIKEFGDKLSDSNKSELESVLSELKSYHKSGEIDKLEPTINKLNETWNRISTELYSQASQQPPQGETPTGEAQDVSYEEVNN